MNYQEYEEYKKDLFNHYKIKPIENIDFLCNVKNGMLTQLEEKMIDDIIEFANEEGIDELNNFMIISVDAGIDDGINYHKHPKKLNELYFTGWKFLDDVDGVGTYLHDLVIAYDDFICKLFELNN